MRFTCVWDLSQYNNQKHTSLQGGFLILIGTEFRSMERGTFSSQRFSIIHTGRRQVCCLIITDIFTQIRLYTKHNVYKFHHIKILKVNCLWRWFNRMILQTTVSITRTVVQRGKTDIKRKTQSCGNFMVKVFRYAWWNFLGGSFIGWFLFLQFIKTLHVI